MQPPLSSHPRPRPMKNMNLAVSTVKASILFLKMAFNLLNMPLCTLRLMNILLVWPVCHLGFLIPTGFALFWFGFYLHDNILLFILLLLLCHSGTDCLGWDLVSCLLDSQALLLNYDKYLWRGLLSLLCLCPSPSPFLVSLARGAAVATYKRKWTWKCYANQIVIVAFGHLSVVNGWRYYVCWH